MASGVCPDGDAACRTTVLYLGPAKLGDDFFEARYEAFQRDWTGVPDAVLADGESAFSFVRKYGEDLFGEAPVIYLGMARPDQALTSVLGRYSGVPLVEDVAGTLDLIFRLEPQTSLVVGVMDGTPESRALKASVEAAMEPYMDRAQIVFPGHEPGDDGGLDKEALASVASSVPQTGAVLFLGFGSDRDGKDVDEGDCVRLLAERSAGPVYVLTDRWLDRGALGGALALGRDQARAAVGLAHETAIDSNGLPAPVTVPSRVVVDLTVLARFGIPADRLPAHAVGSNPVPIPEESSGIDPAGAGLWGAGLALLLLGLLLVRRLRTK